MESPRNSLASPPLLKDYLCTVEELEPGLRFAVKDFYRQLGLPVQPEPFCRKALTNHLPVKKKKKKLAPWQAALEDGPMETVAEAPGFTLSRNKAKYSAVINTDIFFSPTPTTTTTTAEHDKLQDKQPTTPERVVQLDEMKQRVSDLRLSLEEEKFNHEQNLIKAERKRQSQVSQLEDLHGEEIRNLEQRHREDILELESNHRIQFENCRKEMELQLMELKEDNCQLKREVCDREKLRQEMTAEWLLERQNLTRHWLAKQEESLATLRETLQKEKQSEINSLTEDFQSRTESLQKEFDGKVESMAQYYNNVMEELKLMKSIQLKLKKSQLELKSLKETHCNLQRQHNTMNKEFAHTRGQLKCFEDNFDRKVDEVDDRYKDKINNLMLLNCDLKRCYRNKCEELSGLKYQQSEHREDRLRLARQKFKDYLWQKEECSKVPIVEDSMTRRGNIPAGDDTTTTLMTIEELQMWQPPTLKSVQ